MKAAPGWGLMVTGALLGTPAMAEPIRCDACRTPDDFRREAEAAGAGAHIVFNVKEQLVSRWAVTYDDAVARTIAPAREIPVPPGAAEELRRAHELDVQGNGTLRPLIDAPVATLGVSPHVQNKTAREFVLDRNMQAMIETATGSSAVVTGLTPAGLQAAVAGLASSATDHLGLRAEAALRFKVMFKDGSHVIIKVDMDHANGQYEPDSARTAAGENIPAHIQEGGDSAATTAAGT